MKRATYAPTMSAGSHTKSGSGGSPSPPPSSSPGPRSRVLAGSLCRGVFAFPFGFPRVPGAEPPAAAPASAPFSQADGFTDVARRRVVDRWHATRACVFPGDSTDVAQFIFRSKLPPGLARPLPSRTAIFLSIVAVVVVVVVHLLLLDGVGDASTAVNRAPRTTPLP